MQVCKLFAIYVNFFAIVDFESYSTGVNIINIRCKALCVKCTLFGEHVFLATPVIQVRESK